MYGTRVAVLAAVAALVPTIAACGGGSTPSAAPPPVTTSHGKLTYTYDSSSSHIRQFWGSTHGPYCAMLRKTLHAGDSVLSSLAQDQASQLEAFTSAVTASAPAQVAPSWTTLGAALVALVAAKQDPSAVANVDPKKVAKAVRVIASDAKTRCGLTLGS